jgi:hypothetical protein
VAPDRSCIVFSSSDPRNGTGPAGDLYISRPRADGAREAARNLGALVTTLRTEFCPVVSPDGRSLYFTIDRSVADWPLEAARSTREWNARLDGHGNGLGDTCRVPMSAVFEALGRTLR